MNNMENKAVHKIEGKKVVLTSCVYVRIDTDTVFSKSETEKIKCSDLYDARATPITEEGKLCVHGDDYIKALNRLKALYRDIFIEGKNAE